MADKFLHFSVKLQTMGLMWHRLILKNKPVLMNSVFFTEKKLDLSAQLAAQGSLGEPSAYYSGLQVQRWSQQEQMQHYYLRLLI